MLSQKKEYITRHLKQHKDIITFVLVIVSFHVFWKTGREADSTDQIIHFYGLNFSAFFTFICEIWTSLVYKCVFIFTGDALEFHNCNLHYVDTNTGIRIVWGCSGIKEIIMTILVIAAAKGNNCKKLWYIPIGVLFMLLLNFIRLATLTLLVHHHSEMFDFVHAIIFRFVMYAGLFAVWLVWTERINTVKTQHS